MRQCACSTKGYMRSGLSMDEVDESGDVVRKCDFAFLRRNVSIISQLFSIAFKMCSNYPGINFLRAVWRWKKNINENLSSSTHLICTTKIQFVERRKATLKCTKLEDVRAKLGGVLLLLMLLLKICDVLAAVVLVVA